MNNKLTTLDIAWRNVKSRVYRNGVMMLFIFVLAATLFTCKIILTCMEKGMESTSNRLGSDIVVVPAKYYSSIENALFTGEPCTVYFDKSWKEKLQEVEGVETTSSQLFLATLGEECCETQAQLIAFNEEDDFVISPWIEKNTKKKLTENEVVVGSALGLELGQNVTYYGMEFTVAGVLAESGMGYDHSVFVNYDGAKRIMHSERAANFLATQSDDFISMVNVKIKSGYDIEKVREKLLACSEEIAVYTTNKMLENVEKSVNGFSIYSEIISVILVILSTIGVVSIFSITINERKREFGIFLLFGTDRKKLIKIIMIEVAVITGIGTITGILSSETVLFFFQNLISEKIELPYLELNLKDTLMIALECTLITLGMGTVAAIYSIVSLMKNNGIDLLKEGD